MSTDDLGAVIALILENNTKLLAVAHQRTQWCQKKLMAETMKRYKLPNWKTTKYALEQAVREAIDEKRAAHEALTKVRELQKRHTACVAIEPTSAPAQEVYDTAHLPLSGWPAMPLLLGLLTPLWMAVIYMLCCH